MSVKIRFFSGREIKIDWPVESLYRLKRSILSEAQVEWDADEVSETKVDIYCDGVRLDSLPTDPPDVLVAFFRRIVVFDMGPQTLDLYS